MLDVLLFYYVLSFLYRLARVTEFDNKVLLNQIKNPPLSLNMIKSLPINFVFFPKLPLGLFYISCGSFSALRGLKVKSSINLNHQ